MAQAAATVANTAKAGVATADFTRRSSDLSNDNTLAFDFDGEKRLQHVDTAGTTFTSFEAAGTANLYDEQGNLILMPAPTQDPRDPLNMAFRQKFLGLLCLCCFGALAASAELILGAMLPVFALEYAGWDPKIILVVTEKHLLPPGIDPLVFLSRIPGAPPIWQTYLLGSMPLLIMGLANLFLIPLAITVGRRPVVLLSGILAIGGCLWAGFSQSLGSHVGARCLQAIGAGTVESLIPFIIQDTVFFHQRNTWISGVFAAQGTIIIALGIAAPHLIITLSWRWVYYITALGAGFFLIGVFFFLPETRWFRTKAELNGIPRPLAQEKSSAPRTVAYNLRLQSGPVEVRKGLEAMKDTFTTFFYPHIFFITMLNSAMIATAFASSFIVAPQLLAVPYNWTFLNLGLCLIPVLIAAICVGVLTGKVADILSNYFAKKRGRRLPENQLMNLVFPTIVGIAGSLLFGFAGQYPQSLPWPVFLLGLGMMAFAFLGANTVGAVYVLECYPQLAGPALVNIASFRCIVAFCLSFKVSEWVVELGYLRTMVIYTALQAAFGALIPVVFIWGPKWRERLPGPDR